MPPNRQHSSKLPKDRQADYPYAAPNNDPEPPTERKSSASSAATISNPAPDDSPLDKTPSYEAPNLQIAQTIDVETLLSSARKVEHRILAAILLNEYESLPELLEEHDGLSSALLNSGVYTRWASLLIAAAVFNHPESIHALLTRIPGGRTIRPRDLEIPLLIALERNYAEVARDLLIRLGNRPLRNALWGPAFLARAVHVGNIGIAAVLIDMGGVDVNAPAEGDVPLHRAAFFGDERMVNMLQVRGAAFAMPGLRFPNSAEAARQGGHAFLAIRLHECEAREISRRAAATQPSNETPPS